MKTLFLCCALGCSSWACAQSEGDAQRASMYSDVMKGKSLESTGQVDPTKRAEDYAQAIHSILKEDPSARIYAIIKGVSLDRIIDFEVLPNGTVVKITYKAGIRRKQKLVPVEDIDEIGQR